MLTIISDIHLTDNTCSKTINPRAFKKFTYYLENMIESANVKEIEIILLGDIFDIIRSEYWLKSQIRPWSEYDDEDNGGHKLKHYVRSIVTQICDDPYNKESMRYLQVFKKDMADKNILVKYTYIVGNHDWLINKYAETRVQIAKFIGMENPEQYWDIEFSTEEFWNNYKVFARHGDIYDSFNFENDRDNSSIGDAIVIDLINKFPKVVEANIGVGTDTNLISALKEIDNVRPVTDIPLWIKEVCKKAKTKKIEDTVKEIWNALVKDFLKIKFIKNRDKFWKFDNVDILQLSLGISKYLSFKSIASIPLKIFRKKKDYGNYAFNERYLRQNLANFIVYGHTHNYKIQPLQLPKKMYFNTGTWRKVHVKTTHGSDFLSWNVLTFISFYKGNEKSGKSFEIWNGVLAD